MTGINPTAIFSGNSNHGFQLGSNFGPIHVDFHGQPNKLEEIHSSDEEKRCFETIRTSNYIAQKDLNPERLPGTCNWFFAHPKYRGWKAQTAASRLLWVSADPGCGKSVLAKALVDQYDAGNVCYYFFKDDNAITRSAAHAICAILHQICTFRPALIKYVLPMYRRNGGKLVDLFEDLWSAFVDVINDNGFGSVICIFDAVDECSDDDFKKLLQRLAAIAISSTSIKILITSRPYTSIETALFHKTRFDKNEIRLSGEAKAEQSMIEREVGLYITSKVQEFQELRECNGIFDNASKKLQVHFDGVQNRTYLWVSAVFNELERDVYASEYNLMETINALPDNVHRAYEKILEKSPKKPVLIKVLHIMLAAVRPLSVMEMNMVLSIQDTSSDGPRHSGLQSVDSFCIWLRDLCGFFVSIIDNNLYFTHQTAREFLVGEGSYQTTAGWRGLFQTADSHTCVAQICINYLLLWYGGSVDATFRDYATIYWPVHCQQLAVNQSLIEKVNGFLFDSNSFARWTKDTKRSSQVWGIRWDLRIVDSISSPLTPIFLACNFGWASVIHVLMSSPGINWNQMTEKQETGLAIAAREGHLEIVEFLLTAGADFEIQNINGETALHSAVEENHLKIVKLLLNAGANVNAKTLHFAVKKNHLEIVKLLLAAGANMNAQSLITRTALHLAASWGHFEIVQLLLAAGADFEIENYYGKTALHLAVEENDLEVVKLLLNAGANINAKSKSGTPLHLAALNGHFEIVQLLLAAGPDLEIHNDDGETALHSAVEKSHLEIVKLLLKAGTNVNLAIWSKTALHLAASNGNFEIVQLLLAAGADFEIENYYGKRALHLAVEENHLEIVKLLWNAGANINAKSTRGAAHVNAESDRGTALHLAASNGHFELVELLLAAGADFEIQNIYGTTALNFAVSEGHSEIVKLLLNAGANVNAKSSSGTALSLATSRGNLEIVKLLLAAPKTGFGTALHIATLKGYLEIVELLLAAGADINFQNLRGETALHLAVDKSHLENVKLLLKAGANVNAESWIGTTALLLAASRGHLEIVELLLAVEADTNFQNPRGETALQLAIERNHLEIVKLLLKAGANVNAKSEWETTLEIARRWCRVEIEEVLLAAGAIDYYS